MQGIWDEIIRRLLGVVRVWRRIIATAEHNAAQGRVISEPEAREIVLAIADEEGVGYPGDSVLNYWAYSLARRTRGIAHEDATKSQGISSRLGMESTPPRRDVSSHKCPAWLGRGYRHSSPICKKEV